MRLVDANAYSAEMKDRQEAAWKWRNEAIADEDEVKLARAEGAYTAFTEAKLTMDKHIINPWHRVEEPPEPHKVVLVTGMDAINNSRVYKVMVNDNGTWRPTDYAPSIRWDYWMPIEPPKEGKGA